MENVMKNGLWSLALAMVMFTSQAIAAPQVTVSIIAEKEIQVVEQGKIVTKRVTADDVIQGDVVFYTLNVINKGDEAATSMMLVDPIPESTLYLNGSAYGMGSDISFSFDGGKRYQKPHLLTYVVDGKTRVVSPDEYTHIQWLVKTLASGKSAKVGFQVRVK